jgi:uncharacterized membrane protein
MRKLLEAVGLLALAVLAWMTYGALYGPDHLPDRIPTHFDAAGKATGWGSPSLMLLLPVIGVGVYLLLTVVSRFPTAFNYPVRSTPELLPRLQSVTQDMLVLLKAELACLFAALQWAIIRSARTGEGHLFAAILPIVIVVVLGTVGWYIFCIFRAAAARAES